MQKWKKLGVVRELDMMSECVKLGRSLLFLEPVYSFQASEDSYSRVPGNGYFKLCRLLTVSITPPSPSSSSLQSFNNVKTILGSWTIWKQTVARLACGLKLASLWCRYCTWKIAQSNALVLNQGWFCPSPGDVCQCRETFKGCIIYM